MESHSFVFACRVNKCDFILKSLLLAKQREDFRLNPASEIGAAVWP
jgi:hypothetical protein